MEYMSAMSELTEIMRQMDIIRTEETMSRRKKRKSPLKEAWTSNGNVKISKGLRDAVLKQRKNLNKAFKQLRCEYFDDFLCGFCDGSEDRQVSCGRVPEKPMAERLPWESWPEQPERTDKSGQLYALAKQIAKTVIEKQAAYGDSFGKSGDVMRILYPDGIRPEQMGDALAVVRILDKLFRIASKKDAFGESPYLDLAGYGLLGATKNG